MNNIPTAEEYLESIGGYRTSDGHLYSDYVSPRDLIEFAKMHVQAALEKASKMATVEEPKKITKLMSWNNVSKEDYIFFDVDKESIKNCYPLENIK